MTREFPARDLRQISILQKVMLSVGSFLVKNVIPSLDKMRCM